MNFIKLTKYSMKFQIQLNLRFELFKILIITRILPEKTSLSALDRRGKRVREQCQCFFEDDRIYVSEDIRGSFFWKITVLKY